MDLPLFPFVAVLVVTGIVVIVQNSLALAFSLAGTPLGLLDVQCWARDAAAFGKKHHRRQHPIEQKESQKWLRSFRKVAAIQPACPQTKLISVGLRNRTPGIFASHAD